MKLSLTLEVKDGDFKAKIQNASGQVAEIGKSSITAGQSIENSFGKARRGVESISQTLQQTRSELLGFFSLREGFNLAKSFLDTNVAMDRLRGQLVALTGSAEKAKSTFDFIQKFATETPFEIKGLTEAFITLGNFGIKPTAEVMSAITNQAAKLGASQETLQGIATALGQAWAKQKLQGEEILQLIDRGVPVWNLLEQVTGKNAAALQEMATKGELTRDVISKLITTMNEAASGANAAAMETLGGKISNLSDAWTKFQDNLLADKSEGVLKSIIGGLGDTVNRAAQELSNSVDDQIASIEQKLAYRDFGIVGKAVYSLANIGSTVDQKGLDDNERLLAQLKKLKAEIDGKAEAENKATEATQKGALAMAEEAKEAAKLAVSYKALADAAKDSANQQLKAVDAKQQQAQRSINAQFSDTGGVDRSGERDAATTRLAVKTEQEKSAIVKKSIQERLALIDQAHDKEVEAANKGNGDLKAIDQKWLESKAKVLEEWQGDASKTVDQLIALEEKHRDAAAKIDDEIARHKKDTQAKANDIRIGAKPVEDYGDIVSLQGDAALKYKGNINNALKKGDTAAALREAKQYEDALSKIADKAKEAFDAGFIDEGQLSSAVYDMEKAAKQVDDINQQQADEQKKAGEEVSAEIEKQQKTVAEVSSQIDDVHAKLKEALTINVDATQVTAAADDLANFPKEVQVVIKAIREGDWSSAVTAGQTQTAPGYATGTRLAGFGGGDILPAMLEPGEGVVNKHAMRALDAVFGPQFFDGLNAGASPVELLRRNLHTLKFSTGGRVQVNLPNVDFSSVSGNGGTPINIHLPGGQSFGPFTGSSDTAAELQAALAREVLKRGVRNV